MEKHDFKIGDKVKLKPAYINLFRKQGTKIGEIVEFNDKYIRVRYDGRRHGFPYKPYEIEHIVKVGEQLMFAFMFTNKSRKGE